MASCIEWGIIVHPDDELFVAAFDMLCPLCEGHTLHGCVD